MEKRLFRKVFEQVESEIGESTRNAKCVHLSRKLENENILGASERNLDRYYQKYVQNKDDLITPKVELLDALSRYLNFKDFKEFVLKNSDQNQSSGEFIQTVNQIGKNNLVIKTHEGDINLS